MYVINVSPQTSPRPRLGKFGAYMPLKYKLYKEEIIWEMKKMDNLNPADYSELELIAYFPYPKSTPKKRLIEGSPMRVKPDYDNTAKTITDCLESIGIIENDSQIYKASIMKLYTTHKVGRLEFNLKL